MHRQAFLMKRFSWTYIKHNHKKLRQNQLWYGCYIGISRRWSFSHAQIACCKNYALPSTAKDNLSDLENHNLPTNLALHIAMKYGASKTLKKKSRLFKKFNRLSETMLLLQENVSVLMIKYIIKETIGKDQQKILEQNGVLPLKMKLIFILKTLTLTQRAFIHHTGEVYMGQW